MNYRPQETLGFDPVTLTLIGLAAVKGAATIYGAYKGKTTAEGLVSKAREEGFDAARLQAHARKVFEENEATRKKLEAARAASGNSGLAMAAIGAGALVVGALVLS